LTNKLRKAREHQDIRQYELAGKVQIPAPVISQIENGHRNPTLEVREKLAKALGLKPEQIFPRQVK